jgi:prevent-host-death family protein
VGVTAMPSIRPSSDLRNKYSEISEFCHKNGEPVYITKNGQGDLAVMSIEAFEKLVGKFELYKLLGGYPAAEDLQKIADYISLELREPVTAKRQLLISHRPQKKP